MELNREAVQELMDERFGGNYSRFSKALGVSPSYVHKVLTKEKKCGVKFYSGIINWCLKHDVEYTKYIFLN